MQGARDVTYGYDAAKPQRLVSRTDGSASTTTFGYDAAERVTSVTLPGGAHATASSTTRPATGPRS